jgi:predicted ATP-dependent endonuclease of OLD family
MKLHKLKINGFRRFEETTVYFGDATFCIGPNNSGKSSLLSALEVLFSADKRLKEIDYYSETDQETGERKVIAKSVVLEAEFRNLPKDAPTWRGFKGRVFSYPVAEDSDDTGLSITYRKTYNLGEDVVFELKSKARALKEAFQTCKKPNDFINSGGPKEKIEKTFKDIDKAISKKDRILLEEIDELWDVGENEEWFQNPGGIPGIVLNRLPKFLKIPAEPSAHEIGDPKKGVLGKTLIELFEDVRSQSENYKQAQKLLDELAKELDPSDENSDFGKMMGSLNSLLSNVFPDSSLHASADLSDPNTALVPNFNIQMSSNVKTPISHQGTGMIRSAVFAMLRFRHSWLVGRSKEANRSLIIGYEEPEIYLHPSAANQMRDEIYNLSSTNSQIITTTHSPFLIDLSRKPRQVLNKFNSAMNYCHVEPFNVSDEFNTLSAENKTYVKMVLKIDDHVSRSFFTKVVIIVEGDTEEIVLKEAISRLPEEKRLRIKSDFEIIKARGKGSIIGLAQYFHALKVNFKIIHDRDKGTPGAEIFNDPIANAAGGSEKVFQLHECIEDVLGYKAPSKDKPHKAFEFLTGEGETWEDLPEQLRKLMQWAFSDYI